MVLHGEHESKPIAKPIEVVSTTKLARGLTANTTLYLGSIECTIDVQLNFTNCAAHGTESQEVRIGGEHSEFLWDEMETSFSSVSMEPSYPV